MFDWITKNCMTETLADKIIGVVCIVSALAVIGLIGWAIDKWESKEKK